MHRLAEVYHLCVIPSEAATQEIDSLNTLAAEVQKNSRRFETTEELLDLFKNPAKYATPVPLPLQDAMDQLLDLFPRLSAEDRRAATARLNSAAKNSLLKHANSLCARAVKLASPPLLEKALVALAAEGGNTDMRDSILALKAIADAAKTLGLDARKIFSGCRGPSRSR